MLRVGLTGGIGSGKSEVSGRLAARGAIVIDSDLLSRAVVSAGTDAFEQVVEVFGRSIVGPDGQLDRSALGAAVFADADARRRLESIVHPRVRARATELEDEAVTADRRVLVVHDIPLLVETGQADGFDVVVVVDAPDEVRRQRLVRDRGMQDEEAIARIAAQATRCQRLAAADEVIDNSGALATLDDRVDALWRRLRATADGSST